MFIFCTWAFILNTWYHYESHIKHRTLELVWWDVYVVTGHDIIFIIGERLYSSSSSSLTDLPHPLWRSRHSLLTPCFDPTLCSSMLSFSPPFFSSILVFLIISIKCSPLWDSLPWALPPCIHAGLRSRFNPSPTPMHEGARGFRLGMALLRLSSSSLTCLHLSSPLPLHLSLPQRLWATTTSFKNESGVTTASPLSASPPGPVWSFQFDWRPLFCGVQCESCPNWMIKCPEMESSE